MGVSFGEKIPPIGLRSEGSRTIGRKNTPYGGHFYEKNTPYGLILSPRFSDLSLNLISEADISSKITPQISCGVVIYD